MKIVLIWLRAYSNPVTWTKTRLVQKKNDRTVSTRLESTQGVPVKTKGVEENADDAKAAAVKKNERHQSRC